MENNIPAFPHTIPEGMYAREGMTLLDYFAAKAMIALMEGVSSYRSSEVAAKSYLLGVAMLEERKKYI